MFLMAAYKVAGFVEIVTHMLGSDLLLCPNMCHSRCYVSIE